jgi:hypothetical protein
MTLTKGWISFVAAVAIGMSVACHAVGDDGAASDAGTAETSTTGAGDGPYCPGVSEWDPGWPTCRSNDDCVGNLDCQESPEANGATCSGPGGCKLGWAQGPKCATNDDCVDYGGDGVDGVCRSGVDPCCGEVSVCVIACTADTCEAGEACGADGLCGAVACDDGYACAAGSLCEPNAPSTDAHGCVLIPCDQADATPCLPAHECVSGTCTRPTCTVDADCPCGTCAATLCWERPWVCVALPG